MTGIVARTMDIGVTIGARLLPALAALLFAVAGPVAAQADAAAGRFIAVTGDVKIIGSDGGTRIAVRNGEIRQGDSIVTGANSLAQLRMSDGGAVSVRADTQLKLDAYRFTNPEDRDSSFAVSILKGGFRALTGLIARTNRQNYRVSTSSMTIGVRGTHFEVVHVLQPVADAAAGTYNRVYDGTIAVQNRAGASVLVSPGQTVFVALPSNLPPVLIAPPVGIFGKPTPVPQVIPQSRQGDGKAEGGAPAAGAVQNAPTVVREVAPARTLSAPLLNPIDTPRVLEVSPTLTAPATSTIISPTTTTISPALTAPATSTILSPTTTTTSPTLTAPATSTIISPTTTTISPTLTAPTTTTIISPTTTTISPILTAPTTTISPVLTAPTTTTVSPVLTAPTTTIQTAPTTSTIIKR